MTTSNLGPPRRTQAADMNTGSRLPSPTCAHHIIEQHGAVVSVQEDCSNTTGLEVWWQDKPQELQRLDNDNDYNDYYALNDSSDDEENEGQGEEDKDQTNQHSTSQSHNVGVSNIMTIPNYYKNWTLQPNSISTVNKR
ncbi:hypothetical protein ACA910_003183 [Epithemia clementina (nom. ined.)]